MNAPMVRSQTIFRSVSETVGGLRLRVFTDMEAVKSIWVGLEATGVTTVYQSFVWCRAWLQRVGRHRGILPCILVAEDGFGTAMYILPLQVRHKLGVTIIEALSAPQGAYAFGVFNPTFLRDHAALWFHNHFANAVAALPRHDVLYLANMPAVIAQVDNPMLQVTHFSAANLSYIMGLEANYQDLLQRKRSPETRRSLRKRDAKLHASGDLVFDLPTSLSDRKLTVETMLQQQKVRLAEIGVHNVFDTLEQQFIIDLIHAQTAEGAFLRPYRLTLDGQILAVMLGAYCHKTYWALISSLAHGDSRKHSPGDYALRAMINALCDDGTIQLDFSAGDTAYKSHWADRSVPLYFIVRASTFKGLLFALCVLLREKAKRLAKQTPMLHAVLFNLRRIAWGRTVSS